MKNLFSKVFKGHNRLKTKEDRVVAGTSTVLAIAIILASLIIPKVQAKGVTSASQITGNGTFLYDMCIKITEGCGENLAGIFDGSSSSGYARAFHYCTGIEGANIVSTTSTKVDYVVGADGRAFQKCTTETTSKVVIKEATDSIIFDSGYKAFREAIKAIATIVFCARIMAMILQKVIDGQDPMEQWLLGFVKIGLGSAVIIYSDKIVSLVCYVGMFLGQQLSSKGLDSSTNTNAAFELYKTMVGDPDPNFFEAIGPILQLLIPYALSFLISIATNFVILQTMIEIGLRRIFVPWPIADLYQEGLRSPGARYIKKLLASIVKLSVMYLVVLLAGSISSFLMDGGALSGAEHVGMLVLVNVTTLGMMFKTGEIVNDVIGV